MRCFSFLLATALLMAPALAHEPRTGPHGGPLVHAGAFHVEVVTRDKAVEVYLSDMEDKPVSATGFTGTAILTSEGAPARVPLTPASDGSKLTGAGEATLPMPPKGAVRVSGPDGRSGSASFK